MSNTDIMMFNKTIIGKCCEERFLPAASLSIFADTGIALAGESELRGEYSIYRKSAKQAVLLYSLEGCGALNCGKRIQSILPGTMVYLPSGSDHHYWLNVEMWRILWFHLETGALGVSSELCEEPLILKMSPPAELTHLMHACLEHPNGGEEDLAAYHSYAQLIRNKLVTEFRLKSQKVDMEMANRFSMLLRTMNAKYGKNWTISTMAKQVALSEGHFQRLFKAWCGTTPMKKLLEIRMSRATEMLSNTTLSLNEVADRVGFSDQFAFSKAFKRWSGSSPSSLNRAYSKN